MYGPVLQLPKQFFLRPLHNDYIQTNIFVNHVSNIGIFDHILVRPRLKSPSPTVSTCFLYSTSACIVNGSQLLV